MRNRIGWLVVFAGVIALGGVGMMAAPFGDVTTASAQSGDVDRLPIVTIQTQVLDEDGQPIASPVMSLYVGQKGEIMILYNDDDEVTEGLSLSIHVVNAEEKFYQVEIEAQDTTRDADWAFSATTYLRADHENCFQLTAGDSRLPRTLSMTLFETRPARRGR